MARILGLENFGKTNKISSGFLFADGLYDRLDRSHAPLFFPRVQQAQITGPSQNQIQLSVGDRARHRQKSTIDYII